MINSENLEEVKKSIEELSKEGKKIIVQGKDISFNRIILENKKVNFLVLNHKNKKDKLKQQDSGLNHVLCNIARENNIAFIFDFSEILNSRGKERALILARWMQNIDLMKKAKNKIKIINQEGRDARDLFAFLLTLGMKTDTAKESIN